MPKPQIEAIHPESLPDPADAVFRGEWFELPTPAWPEMQVVNGLDGRLERVRALAELLGAANDDAVLECVSTVGGMIDQEVRGLRVLLNRMNQLRMERMR